MNLSQQIKTPLVLLLTLFLGFSQLAQAGSYIVYLHHDALGNVVAKSDQNGNIISRESVTPFGKSLGMTDHSGSVTVGDTEHRTGYTGHVRDRDLGLTYMQARYYDPRIGRFMGVDPVSFSPEKPEMFNRYAYANNSPYRYVDPDGKLSYPGLKSMFEHAIANAFQSKAREVASNISEYTSRESIAKGLSRISAVSLGGSLAATALAQPEVAVPLAVVSTTTGLAGAALEPDPIPAVAIEVAATITGAKIANVVGTIGKGILKKGVDDSSTVLDTLEESIDAGVSESFKKLSKDDPRPQLIN